LSADPERAIEDLFNQEIFGVDTSNPDTLEPEPPIEMAPVPEPKSVGEAIQAAEDGQEEETPEPEVEGTPLIEMDLDGEGEDGTTVTLEEEEYVAWAKKQFGDDVDLENASARKLAKSAFEKEKMLGAKSQEAKELREAQDAAELQRKIDALTTPGALTEEDEAWVETAATDANPFEYAYNAHLAGRDDLYNAILSQYGSMGPQEEALARRFHGEMIQRLSQPQLSPQEQQVQMMRSSFADGGLDYDAHREIIIAKAGELGENHPMVRSILSENVEARAMAIRGVYDLAMAGKTTVHKAKLEDDVQSRVKEEQLRQKVAGVTTGKPHVEAPKKSAFWEGFDEELKDRGWDGNGPTYGRD
jgi:hypothetical protein